MFFVVAIKKTIVQCVFFFASEPAKFKVICMPMCVCEAHANETCVTADWFCVIAVILKQSEQVETSYFTKALYVGKSLLTDMLSW